jgi:hypothetical protein
MLPPVDARRQEAQEYSARVAASLKRQNVSVRELARRIAASTGSDFEIARNNAHRLLRGQHVPRSSTRRLLADCLNDPSLAPDDDEEEESLVELLHRVLRVVERRRVAA